jgi:LPS-assembly lipoprotein
MKILPKSLRTFFILALFVSLAACGFKLRGHAFLPPEMRTIYLKSHAPYEPFTQQLRQTLISTGIQLVENEQAAPITVNILSDGTPRALSGMGTTTQINTYQLIYAVRYEILDQNGRILGTTRTVSARRDYTINANEVLSTTEEYTQLEQDMRRDTIAQIINQLGSKSVLKHLPPK